MITLCITRKGLTLVCRTFAPQEADTLSVAGSRPSVSQTSQRLPELSIQLVVAGSLRGASDLNTPKGDAE